MSKILKDTTGELKENRKRKPEGMNATGLEKGNRAEKKEKTELAVATGVTDDNQRLFNSKKEATNLDGEGEEGGDGALGEPEVKRLRCEMQELQRENELLQASLMNKEAEVRLVVSKEMAEYSASLLAEIKALREQLDEQQSSSGGAGKDLTRSCRKAHRRHLDKARDDLSRDLGEAEEELQRCKAHYETEVARLSAENAQLSQDLAEWRRRAESAIKRAAAAPRLTSTASTSPNCSSGSVVLLPHAMSGNNAPNAAIAECFNKRMGRDHRFQKTSSQDSATSPPQAAKADGLQGACVGDENVGPTNKFNKSAVPAHKQGTMKEISPVIQAGSVANMIRLRSHASRALI